MQIESLLPLLGGREVHRIFLSDFAVDCRIGIHDFERERPQRVLVNVDLIVAPPRTARPQDIVDVLDYDFLRTGIRRLADEGHVDLQETLCLRILELCLEPDSVLAAKVSTRKPDVYPDAKAVGYEVLRVKQSV